MQTQDIELTKGQEALYNELTKGKRITRKQREVLIKIIYNYTFSKEQLRVFVNNDYTKEQARVICNGYLRGLTTNQMSLCTDPAFSPKQMKMIIKGFAACLSMEQIRLYADKKFSEEQMEQIWLGFVNDQPIESIKIYARPEFDEYQMEEIWLGLSDGLSIQQVKRFAKPEFSFADMKKFKEMLKNDTPYPEKYLETKAKYKTSGIPEDSKEILCTAAAQGVPIQKIDILANSNLQKSELGFLVNMVVKNIKTEDNERCKKLNTKDDLTI